MAPMLSPRLLPVEDGAGAHRVGWVLLPPWGDGWERRVLSRLSGPGVAAAAVSGPMALSGLKLRGKDIGKPIEKGPRAK